MTKLSFLPSQLTDTLKRLFAQKKSTFILSSIMGICFAANVVNFSLLNSLLFKPYPYPDEDRIVMVWNQAEKIEGRDRDPMSIALFTEIRDQADVFESVALYDSSLVNVSTREEMAEVMRGLYVTPSFFATLGMSPMLGRGFEEDEALVGSAKVAILTHDFWISEYNSDPSVLGSRIVIEGEFHEIIGVMPETFFDLPTFDTFKDGANVLVPIVFEAKYLEERLKYRHHLAYAMVGRLKTGIGVSVATAALEGVYARSSEVLSERLAEYENNVGFRATLIPLREDETRNIRNILYLLQAVFGLLFLLGCSNTASLLISRNTERLREFAIRSSLGASDGVMFQRFLFEGLWLGLGSVVIALVVIFATKNLLLGALAKDVLLIERLDLFGITMLSFVLYTLLLFVFWVSVISYGQYRRLNPTELLRSDSRTGSAGKSTVHTRSLMVVFQVASTLALLIASGLFAKNMKELLALDPGFATDDIHSARFYLSADRYSASQRVSYVERLVEGLEARRDVESVGIANFIPFSGIKGFVGLRIRGEAVSPNDSLIHWNIVNESFLDSMNISLINGRFFESTDIEEGQRVVVIDQFLAERHFADRNPIGMELGVPDENGVNSWASIVGVVSNIKIENLEEPQSRGMLYSFYKQGIHPHFGVAVKMADGRKLPLTEFNSILSNIDPMIGPYDFKTMNERMNDNYNYHKMLLMILLSITVMALLLVTISVYGIFSSSMEQRAKEIAIRLALGATPDSLLKRVLFDGCKLMMIGVLLGVAISVACGRFLENLLHGVDVYSVAIYFTFIVTIGSVAILACYFPARRAVSVSPMKILKEQ